ncbi:hypothetical protein K2P97_08535 [bacterium]|nr:hypothetical protein [bacterium]
MNTKYLVAIGATIIIMALLFSKDKKEMLAENSEESVEENSATAGKPVLAASSDVTLSAASVDKTPALNLPVAEAQPVNPKVAELFAKHLQYMNNCLAIATTSPVGDKVAPTADNLFNQLRSSLGDVVVQMDDWSQTEISDQGSVRKRVRVDYDYIDGANPTRRLSMYQINSYGMPEIMSLSNEEINNPNQAYIDSLIEGNKVVNDEKGARAYFAEGEELIYTIRNGQIQSISINRADKSLNCFNLDDEKSTCTCP